MIALNSSFEDDDIQTYIQFKLVFNFIIDITIVYYKVALAKGQ